MFPHWLELTLFSALVLGGSVSFLSALIYPKIDPFLLRIPCEIRARVVTVWLVFPPLTALLVPLSSLVPNWLDNQPLGAAHCSTHENGFAHLCWFEPISDTFLMHIGALVFVSSFVLMLVKIGFTLFRSRRLQQQLLSASMPEPTHGYLFIETDYPIALCAGLMHPCIFISRPLQLELSKKQLAVILAHEQNHCRRRDILRRVLVTGFSLFHWPSVRRELLSDLELAQEQICDEAAADRVGDRLSVAETIVLMERRARAFVLPEFEGAMAFHESHTEARVRALLRSPRPLSSVDRIITVFTSILVALGLFTLSMPLHHLPALF